MYREEEKMKDAIELEIAFRIRLVLKNYMVIYEF
jgi:hypothetical protein